MSTQTAFGRLSVAILLSLVFTASRAQVELSDGRSGMACLHYAESARMAWQQKGGDWVDAAGKKYGDQPFDQQRVGRADGQQTVTWDVTALAREWERGALPRGGIFLRQLGDPASTVVFHSREADEAAVQPLLILSWDDGFVAELRPTADSSMSCSSFSGKGTRKEVKVGGGGSTVIAFPFESRPGARLRNARLQLVTDKQFGGQSDVGVFRLDAPFAASTRRRAGIAEKYVRDEGIEAHPSVIFATGFESLSWQDEWSSIGRSSNAKVLGRPDGNGFRPLNGNGLAVTVEKGKKAGLSLEYKFGEKTGAEPEEAYFRYYLRLGDNWRPRAGGKLPGLAGTYGRAGWGGRRSDGRNGWSARGRFAGRSADGVNPVGSYVYHGGMHDKYGDGWGWNLGSTGLLENNRWYSIEQQVKLNRPGKDDGILRAWIDGVLVFERTDLRYRDVPELRIETLWMNVYHGGTARAQQDLTLYIDNVVVAREYIGPAATGKADQRANR